VNWDSDYSPWTADLGGRHFAGKGNETASFTMENSSLRSAADIVSAQKYIFADIRSAVWPHYMHIACLGSADVPAVPDHYGTPAGLNF